MITHLSWHPGPDPKAAPMAWAPLCGATVGTSEPSYSADLDRVVRGFAINPFPSNVDCPDCMVMYWSGQHAGVLSDRTPRTKE